MSFGALRLKVSGSVMPAAASSPVLVQQMVQYRSASSTSTITFDQTATAGNTLLLGVRTRTTATPNTPAGWTPIGFVQPSGSSTGYIYYYQRTSDGSESSLTYTWTGTVTDNPLFVQEWEGAVQFGTMTALFDSSVTASQAFGPADAPPSAHAVPSMFIDFGDSRGAAATSVASPWIAAYSLSIDQTDAIIMTEAAPNAPASGTITTTSGGYLYWSNIWVDKA